MLREVSQTSAGEHEQKQEPRYRLASSNPLGCTVSGELLNPCQGANASNVQIGAHLGSVLDAIATGSAGGVVQGVRISAGDVLLDIMGGLHASGNVKTATREGRHLGV